MLGGKDELYSALRTWDIFDVDTGNWEEEEEEQEDDESTSAEDTRAEEDTGDAEDSSAASDSIIPTVNGDWHSAPLAETTLMKRSKSQNFLKRNESCNSLSDIVLNNNGKVTLPRERFCGGQAATLPNQDFRW